MVVDTYSELCLVTIQPEGGTAFEVAPIVNSFDITGGDKSREGVALLNGGRANKFVPQADIELSFEGYTVGINPVSGNDVGLGQHFENPTNLDTETPFKVNSSNNHKKFRIAFLWTEDTSIVTATAAPTKGYAERISFVEAYLVSDLPSFSDYVKKSTFRFSLSPLDIDASANVQKESTADSATKALTVLASYTSSNKW